MTKILKLREVPKRAWFDDHAAYMTAGAFILTDRTLRELLEVCGKTQTWLAEKLDVNARSVRRWLSSNPPYEFRVVPQVVALATLQVLKEGFYPVKRKRVA